MIEERQKVLVTGARGMLGWALTKKLGLEYQLIGIDIEDADITDESQIKEEIFNIRPDVVIHCAAYTNVDNCEKNKILTNKVNSKGTENVAHACKLCQAKLLYISTDFVFDGSKKTPYTEDDVPRPVNTYGRSKLEGEKQVQDLLENYLIIRTSWLYGPHGQNFIDKITAPGREKLEVINDQIGSPTYTMDLAQAIGKLIKKDTIGILNVTNSGYCSWYNFAAAVLSIKKIDIPLMPTTSDKLKTPARRPLYSVLSNDKFYQLMREKLRPWQEALAEYLGN